MKKIILLLGITTSFFFYIPDSFCQWIVQDTRTDIDNIECIEFLNANTGIACGGKFNAGGYSFGGRALYTTNAGANWHRASTPDSARFLAKAVFINDNVCYVVGSNNDSSHGIPYCGALFMKSTDHGKSWFNFGTIPFEYEFILDLDFINENTGYISVQNCWGPLGKPINSILKTTDACQSWQNLLTLDSLSDLYQIQVITEKVIMGVGGNGHDELDYQSLLVKSIDGGVTWERKIFPELIVLDGFFFTDENNGFFTGRGGGYGRTYRSTDQGVNWVQCDSVYDIVFPVIHVDFFPGSGTGIVYGFQNTPPRAFVFRTTDYGVTWNHQFLSIGLYAPFDGCMLSEDNNYLGCNPSLALGKILHTTNGGSTYITGNEVVLTQNYTLQQNYPNPFNPKTVISYKISKAQFVRLEIYNSLGKHIEILVNARQNAGEYSFHWEASNYSSGTYYYKLTGENFTETKKMVLLK